MRLEGELLRLAPLLDEFPVVVLKGPVLAHGAYPDPLLRPFTDLDLLIPGPRLEEFVVALSAFGYERARPEPVPGFDARVGKAVTVIHRGDVVIDLHRTLVAGIVGASIDVDAIVADHITVAVGSMAVPAPSWEAHLIETALHAVVGDGLARALSLRDVAQVALDPRLDVEGALALAARWDVSAPLADALRASMDGLGLAPPDGLAAAAADEIGPEVGMPAAVRSARSRIEELRGGSLRHRVTLTRALVAPSPAFLRWRYGDLPLPSLYARRWRSLHQRAFDPGRGVTNAAAPLVFGAASVPTDPVPDPREVTLPVLRDKRAGRPIRGAPVVPSRRPPDSGPVALAERPPRVVAVRASRATTPGGRPWGGTTGPVEPRPSPTCAIERRRWWAPRTPAESSRSGRDPGPLRGLAGHRSVPAHPAQRRAVGDGRWGMSDRGRPCQPARPRERRARARSPCGRAAGDSHGSADRSPPP